MNLEETKQAFQSLIESLPNVKVSEYGQSMMTYVRETEDASEVAGLLKTHFSEFYDRLGDKLVSFILNSLTPEVWAAQDILANPEIIPVNNSGEYIVVADGSVKTVQDIDTTAYYYGDVDLTVKDGTAFVNNTRNQIHLEDAGFVVARGYTQVHAKGVGRLDLQEHAHGIAQDEVTVNAFHNSFVEVIGGRPEITAYSQSRFLVSEGSADINMFELSRGVIMRSEHQEQPIDVLVAGDGVLYVAPGDPDKVHIDKKDGHCLLLGGNDMRISPEEMRDLIIPEYADKNRRFSEIIKHALPVEQLKADLTPYLPDWKDDLDQSFFEGAESEKNVCLAISFYIPEMVQKGLTGDFLRSHFTEDTLKENNIIMNALDTWTLELSDSKTNCNACYFFGDQLVNPKLCPEKTYGFEHTLVVNDRGAVIDGFANAIVAGKGEIKAQGSGKVDGLDRASVEASDQVKVHLEGESKGVTDGHVHVIAYDESQVVGHGHTKAELHDRSSMEANDHSQVLTLGDNEVLTMGKTEVAFPNYETGHRANIVLKSNEATLIGLDHPDKVERYRASMAQEPSKSVSRSSGWGR